MVILVGTFLRMDEIGMSINPDDLKVLVVTIEGVKGGSAHWMISTNRDNYAIGMQFGSFYDLIVDFQQKVVK